MKNEIIDNLNLSEQQQKFIEEIKRHLSSIESDMNFEKYSKFLNPKLINSTIHFTYEKDIFFEKDNILINRFNSIYDQINFIKPKFILSNTVVFFNLKSEYKDNFESIYKKIEDFNVKYINSNIEEYLILQNLFLNEKVNTEKTSEFDSTTNFSETYETQVNNLIDSILDEKSKEHLKNYIDDYQQNLKAFDKFDSNISILNWFIWIVPIIIFLLLLGLLMLIIFI